MKAGFTTYGACYQLFPWPTIKTWWAKRRHQQIGRPCSSSKKHTTIINNKPINTIQHNNLPLIECKQAWIQCSGRARRRNDRHMDKILWRWRCGMATVCIWTANEHHQNDHKPEWERDCGELLEGWENIGSWEQLVLNWHRHDGHRSCQRKEHVTPPDRAFQSGYQMIHAESNRSEYLQCPFQQRDHHEDGNRWSSSFLHFAGNKRKNLYNVLHLNDHYRTLENCVHSEEIQSSFWASSDSNSCLESSILKSW